MVKKKSNKHQFGGDEVATAGGQGKDQYGRKFGKKHASAMMEFTKTLWMQDSTASLRNLLQKEVAQVKFREFLATEYGEAQLDFFLEASRLAVMPPDQQQQYAPQVYQQFMAAQGSGIGQQDRTKGTQQLWDYANASQVEQVDPRTALNRIMEEAETTLNMLAFDAFPRFLNSKYCAAVMDELKRTSNPNEVASLEGALNTAGSKMAKDADDWLNMFVSTAESFPACIVISDMTIPGAPMVFVNSEFSRTTGYAKEEAVGRNCRFLQGPDTEPESIAVIRNTLSKGQDCHVKLTNYRKNGEKFQNLLSMKPVFDADNIYRFVIGVQFEIIADQGLKKRLVQLDKLLRLLPSRLNLKSKAKARARGKLAANTTGEANTAISAKEQVCAAEQQAGDAAAGGPRAMLEDEVDIESSRLNFDGTIFAFTKIMWLNAPMTSLAALAADPASQKLLVEHSKMCSVVMEGHLEFYLQALAIKSAAPHERERLCRRMHRVMENNKLFYCTNTEIVFGQMPRTDMGPVMAEMENKIQQSLYFLATDMFPRFLGSKFGLACVRQLRAREVAGDKSCPVKTAAFGKNQSSSQFWLELFKAMSETVSVGMVVSDMTIPGIPLAYVNEGFKTVTGYDKANAIGRNCHFLVGPETEGYVTDEIMDALRQHDPLCVKLHNYKANGQKFQCMFCLHPVFGPEGDYKYQIGLQIDFCSTPDITRQLIEMERVLRLLPSTITGDDSEDALRLLPMDYTGDSTLLPRLTDMSAGAGAPSSGGASGAPGGMGMPGMMGGMPPMMGMAGGMGGSAGSSIGGSGGPAETDAGDQIKSDITVGGKKNKTHYGKKFGNKHKGAMMEFTKTLWLQDSTASLRNLLQKEVAQQKFREFLALEYGEAQLDFIVEVFNLEKLAPGQKEQAAVRVYQSFMGAQAGGIGQQERTKGTQQLWDSAASAGVDQVDPNTAYANVKEECDRTLNMLGFDAFPRFLKSKYCIAVMDELKRTSNPNEVAALEGALNTAGSKMAKDADDWLNMFVSTAESFPACIVISDMTIPGAPMVFVNSEFSRTTGYAKEEAVGRNCRFLQGPDTEPESIAVIRNTLSKGQDCHVKLTNYRKNGEKFQNLLSMKPVFDGDGIYRYVIGVQFEIIADQGLKKRLVQLDKLLRLLPSRLNLKSKASAQARGALAAKVTGEANQMISAKEQILNAGEQREEQEEVATGGSRPKGKFKKKKKASGSMMGGSGAPNYDGTIFAFTKIMWLQDPVMALRCMLLDQGGYMALDSFLKQQGSVLAQTHLRFWAEAQQIMMTQGPQQMQAAKALHRRMVGNALFYCTTNEIVIGQLNRTSWPPIIQEMARWQEQTLYFLASDTFARFMEGNQSREYLYALRAREVNGEQLPIKTAAYSKDTNDPNFWMEIFKTMSESLRFGCVVSDMTIPGIPLAHVNEGFRAVTGYGKEVIGKNCKFLTGPATEMYLTEEIMEALRHADPLFTKLHNHKANGQKFQCLLVLHPVFTPEGEYKYQIGGQIDYNPQSPETPMLVMELERVFRNLPQVTTGVAPAAMASKTQEMEAMLGPLLAATGAPSQSAPAAHSGYGGMQQQPMQAQQQWGAPAQPPMQAQQQWGAPSPVAAAPPAQQWGAPAQQPPQQQQQWGAPAAQQWGAAPAASPMMQQQQPPQQQWGAPAAAPAAQQWGAPAAPAAMSTGGWGASPAAQAPPTQQQWGAPAPSATMPVAAQWGASPQMGMPSGMPNGGMQPMPPSNGAPSWAQDQQPRPGAQWAPQQPQW